MRKIFNSRFFSLLILTITICVLLSSCMGSAQSKEVSKTVTNYDGSVNELDQNALNNIATKLYNNFEARDAFFAALRGYNLVDGSYPEDTDFSQDLGVNISYMQKVIEKYTDVKFTAEAPLCEADALLLTVAMQNTVNLEATTDIIAGIQLGIGKVLGWITMNLGFGHFLVGIVIFAILIEILMLPFAVKQQKNSIKQAKLRPKEMAIRNRYKGRNDQATQQKVAQEIQDLYQRENFNPMSGCLPMLIQLPIIMLLYNIVVDPITNVFGGSADLVNAINTFVQASPAAGGLGIKLTSTSGTIEALSHLNQAAIDKLGDFAFFSNSFDIGAYLNGFAGNIPSFNIGNVNLGLNPGLEHPWLLIVPVLTFVVYFGSTKITKKFMYQPTQNENAPGAGCSTKMMEYSMPLMSTFFCFMVPGAVGLYWVFRSILMTIKQFIMSKIMPLPKFTEEDYKAAERELNANRPQRKRKNADNLDPNRERPRSLHHIDDEEEDYPTFVE